MLQSQSAKAQDITIDKATMVGVLMERTGLTEQLRHISTQIKAGMEDEFEAREAYYTPEHRTRLMQVIDGVYYPDDLEALVRAYLIEHADDKSLSAMLKWFSSPIGRKVSKLENRAMTPRAMRNMTYYYRKLQEAPPQPARIRRMKKIDAATQSSRVSSLIANSISIAVAHITHHSQPENVRESLKRTLARIQSMRVEMETEMKRMVIINFLYTYHKLELVEVLDYTDFVTLKSSRNFYDTVRAAVEAVLSERDEELMKRLGVLFPKE